MKTHRLAATAALRTWRALATIASPCGLILCLAAGGASAQPTGDFDTGKIKAQTCMGCHGIPGYKNVYPTYTVPRVGGQHADYIILALKAYKAGERSHKTMRAQAASLSDQDMADIAAYFSAAPSR